MAPPKTMVVGQQQQHQQPQSQMNGRSAQADQAPKSRKKKGKQPQQQQQQQSVISAEKQQVNKTVVSTTNGKENLVKNTALNVKQVSTETQRHEKTATPVTPNERTSITKKQQQSTEVPSSPDKKQVQVSATVLAKQISTEEPDDIDAGIELDGSSNSGSSVKDINEDQIKSASVSPVMAQNNLVKEDRGRTKHAAETGPIEQLAGSLCQEIAPSSKRASLTPKQQLVANQQVIDADEQLLQQKEQNKQRKPSLKQTNTSIGDNTTTSISMANRTANSQGAVTPQSPALCKICEQHVYQMERMMAEKAIYHKSCFRCYQCKIQLRIDNYSSHEGQVYCKAHHRQLFQPQVKLDNDDVDIVAKSKIQKRQMIICENEPAELPKDVVRCDTKVDDGIDRLNLNLNNILERFERGNSCDDSQPSSAGVNIEKPSFNIKETLKAFETKDELKSVAKTERPTVRKLNLNGFLNRQSSGESDASPNSTPAKPLAVRRSESLMLRLKKYESRIAGEQVADDDSDEDENNNSKSDEADNKSPKERPIVPKKLSSLKSQWENGDISKRRSIEDSDEVEQPASDNCNGHSPAAEKNEELISIRQQLARKSSSIKNIYENAIKEAQNQKAPAPKPSDLSALNGFSTTEIQQQLLHNGSHNSRKSSTLSSPDKDHFQLNLGKKANKLRERFEQGLINNSTHEESDEENVGDSERYMSKLDQIRQEKLEDLSIFTEGEIKAREARSMFQQIDRRLSAASGHSQSSPNSRSLASISASMQAKLQSQRTPSNESLTQNGTGRRGSQTSSNNHIDKREQLVENQKPIRLVNNVRT